MTNATQRYKLRQMVVSAVVGFLACSSFATTARYFKFTPTAYADPGTADAYNLAMSEFVLLDGDGKVIAWPQGTGDRVTSDSAPLTPSYLPLSCIVDGQHNQKCIIATPLALRYPYIQIDAGETMEFAAYGWWSSTYSGGDTRRISTAWKVEISDDGQAWTLFDQRSGYPGFEKRESGASEYRGPFMPSVDLTVEKGKVYTIEDGDPILISGGEVKLYGTLDLNGHSLKVGHISNQPETPSEYLSDDVICDLSSAKIINSSSTEATLTVSSMNFAGAITETVGKINLTLTQGTSFLVGYPKSLAPSRIRLEGTAELLPYSVYETFCFRFKKNRAGNAAPIALAEVQLTYGGKAIPETLRTYIGASPSSMQDAEHDYSKPMDGNVYTDWISTADDQDVRLRIVTGDMMAPVDGYRLAAPANRDQAPTDWEVYVYRRFGWFKVDERHDVTLGGPDGSYVQGKLSPDYRFGYAYRPSSQFGDQTEIVQEGSRIRLFGDLSFGKLGGSNNIYFESGTCLASSDYSGWTGAFVQLIDTKNRDLMGHFLIDATRGGAAAQNARLKNPSYANISIENATQTPAALLIDETWPNSEEQPQYGRVADGNGPMGIVKRGAVKRVLETQDSAYTGDTKVEEGTLEVRGPRTVSYSGPQSARYFRFTPTRYLDVDAYDFNLGICEIQLVDGEGAVLAWPAGTEVSCNSTANAGYSPVSCVVDGALDQKCIIATSSIKYPSIVIDAKTFVNFHGYRWWTNRYEPNSDRARLSTGWKLEISADGKAWQAYDVQTDGPGWDTSAALSKSQLRGPYVKDTVEEVVTTPGDMVAPSLLKPFYADTTDRTSHAPALKSRYFHLTVTQVRGSGLDTDVHGFELADIQLYYHGQPVAWPKNVSVMGGGSHVISGALANLFDNDASTAYAIEDGLPRFNVDAGTELTFDAYAFRSSTASDGACYRRLPTSWYLRVSTNRSAWVMLDNVGDRSAELKSEPGALQGPWNVGNLQPLLSDGPNDSLSDVSKVVISEGACLEINAAYEKFGPLTGTGALDLHFGATAHANAMTAATFEGSVTGVGTFAGGGAGGQTLTGAHPFFGALEAAEGTLNLDDASFPNVTGLKLSADGILSGAGSFGGDLAVSFDGGAMDAALTVAGTLDVNGDDIARFKVPDDIARTGKDWSFTPFTAGAISAAAKAKLAAARAVVPEGAPKYRLRVTCTDTTCTVEAYRPGMMLIVR